jgi:hypothetical protein
MRLEDIVENRGEEDAEHGHAAHAGEDRQAERLAHFGAGAGGDHQGHHPRMKANDIIRMGR